MALDAKAAGLATGILWGAAMGLLALFSLLFGYGTTFLAVFQSIYAWGFGATWLGVLLGLVYGFVDGFLAGFITIWLYNKFAK